MSACQKPTKNLDTDNDILHDKSVDKKPSTQRIKI